MLSILKRWRTATPQRWSLILDQVMAETTEGVQNADSWPDWGLLPALSLTVALGLLMISAADTLSRSRTAVVEWLFWTGLIVMVVPIAARLLTTTATRLERISLVVLLGLALYAVKVLHSPYAFTYSDELIHVFNTTQILQTGQLFGNNTILAATPRYPGLETAAAGLASMAGLTVFQAGLILVGAARLLLLLALFLSVESVALSHRIAGLSAVLYTVNSNYLYWSAQYSYESLALPLVVVCIYAVVSREKAVTSTDRRSLTAVALLLILAVVATHHMSAYTLVAFLFGVATLSAIGRLRTRAGSFGPWDLALTALVVTLLWQILVAPVTFQYLSPLFTRAFESFSNIASGAEAPRQLFTSRTGYVAPIAERAAGIGSVLLTASGLPLGLWMIWRKYRVSPFMIIFAVGAVGYLGALGLRLVPAGWEIGNRSSTFLAIGLSIALALSVLALWDRRQTGWPGRVLLVGAIGLVFVGGVISGWPPLLRLSQPLEASVQGQSLEPQGVAAARWTVRHLGIRKRIAAPASDAVLLMAYGNQYAVTGRDYSVGEMLLGPTLEGWRGQVISSAHLQYVMVDQRLISSDAMAGLYFDRAVDGGIPFNDLLTPSAYRKFEQLKWADRVLDSGNLVLYDVQDISSVK